MLKSRVVCKLSHNPVSQTVFRRSFHLSSIELPPPHIPIGGIGQNPCLEAPFMRFLREILYK